MHVANALQDMPQISPPGELSDHTNERSQWRSPSKRCKPRTLNNEVINLTTPTKTIDAVTTTENAQSDAEDAPGAGSDPGRQVDLRLIPETKSLGR